MNKWSSRGVQWQWLWAGLGHPFGKTCHFALTCKVSLRSNCCIMPSKRNTGLLYQVSKGTKRYAAWSIPIDFFFVVFCTEEGINRQHSPVSLDHIRRPCARKKTTQYLPASSSVVSLSWQFLSGRVWSSDARFSVEEGFPRYSSESCHMRKTKSHCYLAYTNYTVHWNHFHNHILCAALQEYIAYISF